MQSVSLSDYLDFARADTLEVITSAQITANIQENLVYRAAEIFLAKYAPDSGVRITLSKNIPLAAGLAGGSTDCAGTLFGLDQFFKTELPRPELETIANSLGSDIAYCLQGGTCLAEGRGENLTKLPEIPKMYGIILKPPHSLSTAEVYKKCSASETLYPIKSYLSGQIDINNLRNNIGNALYPAALSLLPELRDHLDALQVTQPVAAQMSGSGSAFFAFYTDIFARDTAFSLLKTKYEVYAVETIPYAQNIIKN